MQILYKDKKVTVEFTPYLNNNNTAIQLINAKTKEPVARATTNIPQAWPADIIAIKDWTENTGMVDALIEAEIIEPEQLSAFPSGNVVVKLYELTEKAEKERQRQYENNEYAKIFKQ